MFPLCVWYYDPLDETPAGGSSDSGVQNRVLDFFESTDETAEGIHKKLTESLSKFGLLIENVVAYSGDNANVNYGPECSVYQKLKTAKSKIIRANCLCHVIHNTAKYCLQKVPYDVENLSLIHI